MEVLITKLLEYGTTPALLVIGALIMVLLKKIDENGKRDEARAKEMQSFLSEEIKSLENRFDERFVFHAKRMDEISDRVACVERDYLPREEHYKEFSGWRAEINRLSDLIINLFQNQGKK